MKIFQLLNALSLSKNDFSSCKNLHEEFQTIKKAYFKTILKTHPDKGGNPKDFLLVNSLFEAARFQFENKNIKSFFTSAKLDSPPDFVDSSFKPWEFYFNASEFDVPLYKVECARSNRSKCKKCSCKIPKLSIRIGSIDMNSGSYTRWNCLNCWRVPSRIWHGIAHISEYSKILDALKGMNEVLFCGFSELSNVDQQAVAEYICDKSHWAKFTSRGSEDSNFSESKPILVKNEAYEDVRPRKSKTKKRPVVLAEEDLSILAKKSKHETTSLEKSGNFALVPKNSNAQFLSGKTVVMTGIFPEIGGGAGLNLGKDRLKGMLESLGARVTSAISGRTDLLVVGKEPGHGKVSKALASKKCQLIAIGDLKKAVEGKKALAEISAPVIEEYSAGYAGFRIAD